MLGDPTKRRAGTMPLPPSSTSSSTSSAIFQPRVRAKVSPQAVSSNPERPALRTTKSNASIRDGYSSSRPISPAPPVPVVPRARITTIANIRRRSPSPGRSPSPLYAPSGKSRVSPVVGESARVRSPNPSAGGGWTGSSNVGVSGIGGGERRVLESNVANGVASWDMSRSKSSSSKAGIAGGEDKPRVKVKAQSVTHSVTGRPPLISPGVNGHPTTPAGPSSYMNTNRRPSVPSNRSSPGLPANDARLPRTPIDIGRLHHLVASAPPTPPLSTSTSHLSRPSTGNRGLPNVPNGHHPYTPATPDSPELKSVSLPIITPLRDKGEFIPTSSGRTSLEESFTGHRSSTGSNHFIERTVGMLSVAGIDFNGNLNHSVQSTPDNPAPPIVELSLEEEEARVNRKIADLEISNASLLAINRSLEANKAKQRAAINRLRSALQDALSGSTRNLSSHSVLFSNSGNLDVDELDLDLEDPALEERWNKIEDLLTSMKKSGERALQDSKAPVSAIGRVLGWADLERAEMPLEEDSMSVDAASLALGDMSLDAATKSNS